MLSDRKINRVLLLLASLSGAAALVYETIWMRWFRLAFGSTSHAASATLCAYFLGLAIGAALVGRLAGRSARPLRLYGGVEVAAAGAALLVPLALRAYDGIYPALYERLAGAPPLFLAVKVGMALAAMLPCAVLLGGSLPPLVAACLGRDGDLARGGAVVYWANLVGSVLGAVAGGLVLPESIGVPGTYAAGVAGSTAAGLGALWLDRKNGVERASTPASAEPGARETAPAAALAVAGVSGFGLLAFEVLLIHALGRFFAHSTYSFGLVLAVVLLCLAAGAAAVAWSRDRLPAAQLLRGVLLVEAALLFALPWAVIGLRDLLETRPELAAVFESPLARGVLAVGLLGAPALLVAALIFPLTFRMASGGPAGPRLGRTARGQHARRDRRLARGELRAARKRWGSGPRSERSASSTRSRHRGSRRPRARARRGPRLRQRCPSPSRRRRSPRGACPRASSATASSCSRPARAPTASSP
jgi:MFS family permease